MMFQLEMTVRCEPSRAAAATSQPPAAASSRLYGCLPAPRPRPHLAHPSWPALTASITMRCHAASGGLLRLAPTGASALARTNARAQGYMFRNAEYRVALQQTLSRSLRPAPADARPAGLLAPAELDGDMPLRVSGEVPLSNGRDRRGGCDNCDRRGGCDSRFASACV